jgi:predicted NAD/FAD-binding protein
MMTKKKIAVIGGGASGIITGYLLSENYDITIYEKKSILGGNVRTLNKNVLDTKLPSHLNIENGVLGFSQNYYPNFHKLLEHLEVPYHGYKPSISLFSSQHFYPARSKSFLNLASLYNVITKKKHFLELLKFGHSHKVFNSQIANSTNTNLTFNDFKFSQDLYKNYMQALFMLSFSTPFSLVSQLPQSILNPYFLSLPNSKWSFIKNGVFTYIETILRKSKMQVICNAKNIKLTRNTKGISLKINKEERLYDAIVIATTPGSVKKILMDMSNLENKIFNDWDDQNFKTIAHTDLSFYKDYKNVEKTPMDLFYKFRNSTIGYNTYQNTVYKLQTKDHYSFAYNLDKNISKKSILHNANHKVPRYCSNYDSKIKLLHKINGHKNTYYAGAYIYNGLHEGAVESALNISSKLGGIQL